MSDKVVDMLATDLFALASEFSEQSSSSIISSERSNIMDPSGNIECETITNEKTDYQNSYAYCNATPDIATDLSAALTEFGNVVSSKIVTELSITFEAGKYATVEIAGHNHTANAHAAGISIGYADVSAAVPAAAGFGVPTFGVTVGSNATPIRASIRFSMNHIDKADTAGGHWVGKNTTPTAELSMEFEGMPTSQTRAALETDLTGWTVDGCGPSDSNQDFDKFAVTAHRYFDLATA